ncbi:MAG: DUF962 domain protein [Podila humilis]|nr:MAG: DUF962 domain protein [Podila humilis]
MAPAEKSKVFDLKYQLLQYGSHHHNVWNVGIHLTCIPSFSGLPWLLYEFCPPNAALLTMVAYVSYYISLDKVAGLLTAPIFLGLAKHATYFLETNPQAKKIALGVHVVAWIAQFIGHGVFEKRAPKLLDNLLQALVLAPYFVVYEVLFFIGYRPQLKAELDALVVADINAFKAKKEKGQ